MCKLVLTFYTSEILDPTICYSFFYFRKKVSEYLGLT
jgi:hypothetical protein